MQIAASFGKETFGKPELSEKQRGFKRAQYIRDSPSGCAYWCA
jgi:hypothetical protein